MHYPLVANQKARWSIRLNSSLLATVCVCSNHTHYVSSMKNVDVCLCLKSHLLAAAAATPPCKLTHLAIK